MTYANDVLGTHPTDAELRVLRAVFPQDGSEPTARATGSALGLSEHTVKSYVRRLHQRSGVSTPVGLYRWAVRHGLLPQEPDSGRLLPRAASAAAPRPRDAHGLSGRQREVLEAVLDAPRRDQGRAWQVSRRLGCSVSGVNASLHQAYRALGVHSLEEARRALRG